MQRRRLSTAARGYGGKWAKARREYLSDNPWCVMCAERGERIHATVVDHIDPHRGDQRLFWLRSNWQPLCALHHNSTKQREEKRKTKIGFGLDGWPVQ